MNNNPMQLSAWIWGSIIVLVVIVGGYLLFATNPPGLPLATILEGTTTPPRLSNPPVGSSGGVVRPPASTAFVDTQGRVSFYYPRAFTSVDVAPDTPGWMYNATTTGALIAAIVVPQNYEPGTNFGGARFTVGVSKDVIALQQCLTYAPSGGPIQSPTNVTINGVQYKKFTESDAGAGNFFETTSYRTMRNGQCYAVEYSLHYNNLGAYDPSQHIVAFDRAKITSALASIVGTVKLLK